MLSRFGRSGRNLSALKQIRRMSFYNRNLGSLNRRNTPLINIQCRHFAKSRKTAPKKDKFDGTEYKLTAMTETQDQHVEHMKAVYETLSAENTDAQALIRDLDVEVDGSGMPIKAIGTVSKKSQQIIKISLYDESYLDATIKAIDSYESSFNPTRQDDTTIFCAIPKMTQEFKQKLIRTAKEELANAKKGIKREESAEQKRLSAYSDAIEKSDLHKIKKEIENQTAQRVKKVDDLFKVKSKELEKKK